MFESRLLQKLAWLAVCVLAWLAYRPGLSGGFLFDDFVNLDAIGRYGDPRHWDVFLRYITSGTADPVGRPISLLTFLIDSHQWPADPHPFLRTNLLLHLLNGTLLFSLLRLLGRVIDDSDPAIEFAAVVGAACWLLHPLFVSTTLYVVQREAMLPATFTLIGLLAFTSGRVRYARSSGKSGMVLIVAGVSGATLLAILSKANGVLLPLLALVLEFCIFRKHLISPPAAKFKWRIVQLFVFVIPTLVILAYVLRPLLTLDVMPSNRTWTIGQRLLTEPRVMLDYLQLLVVPRSISTGLFNDSYEVAQSVWVPWTTIPALLGIAMLAMLSFLGRKRHPALATAVIFFLAGHLLESTTLPLELYFEHRNYLPAMLLFWPLGRAVSKWKVSPTARMTAAVVLLAVLAGITYQRAFLWGRPTELARIWAASNPGSARAQTVAALADRRTVGPHASLERLLPQWKSDPYELQFAINVVDARCATGGLPDDEKAAVRQAFRNADSLNLMTHVWLAKAIEVARSAQCNNLTLDDLAAWVDAALANPVVSEGKHRDQDFEPLLGMIALYKEHPDQALQHFDRALRAYPNPDQTARQAVLLASSGYYDMALRHIRTYELLGSPMPRTGANMSWLHHRVLVWQRYWPKELATLKRKIVEEKTREARN